MKTNITNYACIVLVAAFIVMVLMTLALCIVRTQAINDAKSKHVYGVYPGGTTLKTANNFYREPYRKPVDPNRPVGFY